MSEHHANVSWQRAGADFDYAAYPRDHTWSFPGGTTVAASAAPGYMGSEQAVDPEEAFVAALSSCHMLTFLAIASKKRFVVDEYVDNAVGHLEKNADGKLCVTRVELHPQVKFAADAAPTQEQLTKLHHSAHENCFIANSVRTAVSIAAHE